MKATLLTLYFIFLTSCASYKNYRQIKEASFDGLKYESLDRYDEKRLAKLKQKKSPLSLCHLGEFDEAHSIYKKHVDKKINDYRYWNEISTCYILEKKYTQAKSFLDLALSRAKSNYQKSIILNNLGVVYMENDNFKEAKEYFKESIKLSNKYLTPKYNLTQIYLKFGLYQKAGDNLEHLLRANPRDVDFLNGKAHLELMQQRYQSALVYFNKIPAQYRGRDDIATNMAMTYFMLGLYENAQQSINNSDKEITYYVNAQVDIEKKIEKLTGKK